MHNSRKQLVEGIEGASHVPVGTESGGSLWSPQGSGQSEAAVYRRKNLGGRPLAENPRTVRLTVRLTEKERKQLFALAPHGDISAFVRNTALKKASHARVVVPPINAAAWLRLGEVIAGLPLNEGHDDITLTALRDVAHQIEELRFLLIGAR